jgi:hypothetical protein
MRALRILLVVAVVLGGLFVAADRIAVNVAESEAAEKIRSSQGLTGAPEVSIRGFPFLTQIARKKLDEVDVRLDGVSTSAGGRTITVTEMTAQLHNVRLAENFSSATADRASGRARISYADLSKAAGDGVTVSYGGEDEASQGRVKVTARFSFLGRTVERSVMSTVSVVDGDTVRLRAEAIPGSEIPGLEDQIRRMIDLDVPIDGLPEGLRLDTVEPAEDGVIGSGTGEHVSLAG